MTTVTEGNQVTFTITRTACAPAERVFFSAWSDSATYDEGDYQMSNGVKPENIAVDFAANDTSKTVTMSILQDGQPDSGERFRAIVQGNPPSNDPAVNRAQTSFITINDSGNITDDFTNTPSTNGAINVGGTANGTIETASDTDWFKITLSAGRQYRFDLEGNATGQGTLGDPYTSIRNPVTGATKLKEDDDAGTGLNAQFTFAPTTTDIYFLAAGSTNNGTGTYLMRADLSP